MLFNFPLAGYLLNVSCRALLLFIKFVDTLVAEHLPNRLWLVAIVCLSASPAK